jgi:pimeloyl-ACP methyl ester carboxylesterase
MVHVRHHAGHSRRAFELTMLLALAGCASLPASRSVTVAGRSVERAVAGAGRPVIVLETGLGADLSSWGEVFPGAAAISTVFAYSRPGYGRSEGADTPRTGRVVVEELRAVLRAEGLSPPYVLVGHSLGGLYMQLFARIHPDEVAGLVLVDSTHPREWAGAPPLEYRQDCWGFLLSLYMTGTRGREFDAAMETGQDVLRAPVFIGKPVVILTATIHRGTAGEDAAKRRDLWELHPGSTFEWVEGGHGIHREHPEVVLSAIRRVVDEARKGTVLTTP